MNVANQDHERLRDPRSLAIERALQKLIALTLVAGTAMSLAIMGLATTVWPSWGQAPSKDLWQTYMDAAEAADAARDFKTEAVVLARAYAFAKQRDSQGQRPVLSQLPLMLAYVELDEKELWQSIAKERLRVDVGNLQPAMRDFISTLDNYGWSYYNRWKAHINDKSEDAFKQTGRLYGAENAFRVEIAFRQKLMIDDRDGLASAEGSLGLVLSKDSKFKESEEEYSKSIQRFRGSRVKLAAMSALSSLFSVGDTSNANAEQTVTETHLDVMLLTARNLVASAEESFAKKRDDVFATQVENARALYKEMQSSTDDVSKFWPRHPFFGYFNADLAWFYQTEFAMTKLHPERYPDSLSKSRESFERAIAILEYSEGPNSIDVRNVVSRYIDLLVAADQPEEAKSLRRRYGIGAVD